MCLESEARAVRIRKATEADLPALLSLAAAKRREYAAYSPVFWRIAADAMERQEGFFISQRLDNPQALTLVAEREGAVEGFLMALVHSAPPVYNPGGPVCSIDDYTVASPDLWPTVGAELLNEAAAWAKARGAALVVIVTANLDAPKRAMLEHERATLASEWWVKPIE